MNTTLQAGDYCSLSGTQSTLVQFLSSLCPTTCCGILIIAMKGPGRKLDFCQNNRDIGGTSRSLPGAANLCHQPHLSFHFIKYFDFTMTLTGRRIKNLVDDLHCWTAKFLCSSYNLTGSSDALSTGVKRGACYRLVRSSVRLYLWDSLFSHLIAIVAWVQVPTIDFIRNRRIFSLNPCASVLT
ncbi:hypothetical protein V1521DRAFT_60598 [Lipomyces starkeyi]